MVAKERPAEGITPTPITDAEFIKATLDYHWTRFVGEAHPEMSHHEAACNFDDVVEAYRRENGMPPGTPPRIVSPYPRPNPMPPEYAELEARSRVQWPGRMSRPTGGRP